jgi:hypothetical protein
MSDPTKRQEFAAAVASAISSIHHLYREVDRLMSGLREHLAEEPDPLSFVGGTFAKAGRDQTRLTIRNDYGALFGPAIADEVDEEDEEFEDEGEEVEDENAKAKNKKRPPVELAANEPRLAVRILMYDPKKREGFEPHIQYAAMSEWAVGKKPWSPDQQFVLRRTMLRRIPKALGSGMGLTAGARVTTKAAVKGGAGTKKTDERQLTCCLPMGVETVALFTLDTAEALERLTQQMKVMWNRALKEPPGQ